MGPEEFLVAQVGSLHLGGYLSYPRLVYLEVYSLSLQSFRPSRSLILKDWDHFSRIYNVVETHREGRSLGGMLHLYQCRPQEADKRY